MSEDGLDTRKLDKIIRALKKSKSPSIKIGILGANMRSDGLSNAEVGAFHEFGTTKIPQRSFLRVPITDHLGKTLESKGAFDEAALKEIVRSGSILLWLKKVAATAEGIVAEAFATNGYGKWKPWKSGYTSKSGSILDDTGQLRNSITTQVKE